MKKSDKASDLEERVSARGMIRYAHEYLQAYRIIKEKYPKTIDLYQVKFYLLCHAIELAFKAYLRHKRYTVIQLRGYGHDLEKLLLEMYQKHKILLSKSWAEDLSQINAYYKTKQFEYFQTGYKQLVDIQNLENLTSKLIDMFGFKINNNFI